MHVQLALIGEVTRWRFQLGKDILRDINLRFLEFHKYFIIFLFFIFYPFCINRFYPFEQKLIILLEVLCLFKESNEYYFSKFRSGSYHIIILCINLHKTNKVKNIYQIKQNL